MEIHQLRYFCAVVRQGTFTRASEAEHVTQPSLSQQILKLEAELGAPLFDRMPRLAKLTVFGQAFLPKAERILRELSDAKTEMLEMTGEERGSVVLGVIPTIAAYLLPQILSGFSLQHPLVKIRVIEEITPLMLERLHEGRREAGYRDRRAACAGCGAGDDGTFQGTILCGASGRSSSLRAEDYSTVGFERRTFSSTERRTLFSRQPGCGVPGVENAAQRGV